MYNVQISKYIQTRSVQKNAYGPMFYNY